MYFEKLRIKEGKPKGDKREDMESIHAVEGGMDTQRRRDHVYVTAGDSVHVDAYARFVVNGRNLD